MVWALAVTETIRVLYPQDLIAQRQALAAPGVPGDRGYLARPDRHQPWPRVHQLLRRAGG